MKGDCLYAFPENEHIVKQVQINFETEK